jgi:shikimate kinase
MPQLTLIGYRGTGKSTVAQLLAERLGCEAVDADLVLEQKLGQSITELIRNRGESVFREEESLILAEQLLSFSGILATGGGVVLRPENRSLLRTRGRPVVWLDAGAEAVRRRLAADPATVMRRPALSGVDPLDEVAAALTAREPLYRECADLRVDTSTCLPQDVAGQILGWLSRSGLVEGHSPSGEGREVGL